VKTKIVVPMLLAVVLILAFAVPARAQLGDTDVSQFTVQNISGGTVTVTVTFYDESGTPHTPATLNSAGTITNPFSLQDGKSQQIYVPDVPGLLDGSYAVEISSTGPVVAMAGLAGDTSTAHFVGSYSGFSSGSTTSYLGVANYNYYGWFGMITVQNLGGSDANVQVTISCSNNTSVGTLTANGIKPKSSHTFVLKNEVPSGFTAATSCNGSAQVESTNAQPIVAVNNQNQPAGGNTISYGGEAQGASTLYIANLQSNYFGWVSSLNIRKLNPGSTTVTIDYSDAEPDDTCNLTDAQPACNLFIPTVHPTSGRFSAKVSSNNGNPLIAVVGSSNGHKSGAVVGVSGGTSTVTVPLAMKAYYGWSSAINCQNVGTVATQLNVSYTGYTPYDTPTALGAGASTQILTANEAFLPNGFYGGVVITAKAAGAQIACTVGNTNSSTVPGDWTNQYNAFNK
jgi:hypothetical protein